jgi:hypothetical protein
VTERPLLETARRLIADTGGTLSLQQFAGGGNNRLYLIVTGCGSFILKEYFRHQNDPRNRLDTEFDFATFAWEAGIRSIAEPIGRDRDAGVAIYRYLEGRSLTPEEVGAGEIDEAIAFIAALNRHRESRVARVLPDASEACFSLAGHLERVEERIGRLLRIEPHDAIDVDACRFVQGELVPAWQTVRTAIEEQGKALGIPCAEVLSSAERLISPSDFGFHNVIAGARGLSFVDFEYAGWDDPAKTVGDFFSQVAMPVPFHYFDRVATAVAACVADPHRALARMRLLLPLYRVKWCGIVLNHFLPVARERRHFAAPEASSRREEQLAKARALLAASREFM